MGRQRYSTGNAEGTNQGKSCRIHPQSLGQSDDRRNQDSGANGLAGENQMAEYRDENKSDRNHRRGQVIQSGRVDQAVNHPARGLGIVQRAADGICPGGENHQIPLDIRLLPFDDADSRHQTEEHTEYSGLLCADRESEPALLIIPGRPQKQGGQENNRGPLFLCAHRPEIRKLLFQRGNRVRHISRELVPVAIEADPDQKNNDRCDDCLRKRADQPLHISDVRAGLLIDKTDGKYLGAGRRHNNGSREGIVLNSL